MLNSLERREGLPLLSEGSLNCPEYSYGADGGRAVGGAAGVVSGGGLLSERRWGRCPGVEAVFPYFVVVVEVSSGGILSAIVPTESAEIRRFLVDRRYLKRAQNGSAESAQPG